MRKHFLLTISDDVSCLHGVRFICSFFGDKLPVRVTLFYVAPPAGGTAGELEASWLEAGAPRQAAVSRQGGESLRKCSSLLCSHGFSPDNIKQKVIGRQFGTAKDIIREGETGLYDAVILGRRGYYLLESILGDSVSNELVTRSIVFPLWVCREPAENRRHVLLCTDGSAASARSADHVGYIMRDTTEHTVTILHVDSGGRTDPNAPLDQAAARLLDNGVDEGRIRRELIRARRVSRAIHSYAVEHDFAAVAVGHAGQSAGGLKGWLLGSKTRDLLQNLSGASLWVSH